jgi:hypothetical protein
VEAIADLRRAPGPRPGGALPAAFLKHADEQTVVGLSAVFHALAESDLRDDFRDWGVLAAPRYLGRWAMAASLQRYLVEGAWGVSPHVIPHRSLHSISGTVSQALKIHGPNFGTGGGPGCETEALLNGLALLHGKQLPGVWLVFTRMDPELPFDDVGRPPAETFLEGLALALTPAKPTDSGLILNLCVSSSLPVAGLEAFDPADFHLGQLQQALSRASAGEAGVSCAIGAGLHIELTNQAAGQEPARGTVLLSGHQPATPADRRPRRSA